MFTENETDRQHQMGRKLKSVLRLTTTMAKERRGKENTGHQTDSSAPLGSTETDKAIRIRDKLLCVKSTS